MASNSTSVVTTDIYKLTQFVESIKSRYIDIPDETLYLGMYGYLSAIFTNTLENSAVMASEYSGEAIPTKAKFEKNIIAHALSLGIEKIFANPATIDVVLCLPQEVIDNLMSNNVFYLDKESVFTIGSDKKYPFKLDYDIQIRRNTLPNGSITYSARYITDDYNPLAEYTSPYLPAIQLQEEGSQMLMHLMVTLRQVTHKEIYKKILVTNPLETKVMSFDYENQLAYFYVEVSEPDSITGETKVHQLLPVYDGLYNDTTETTEYINYMFLDDSNVRLTFNRDSYQPRSNAEVTIHVFTTLGSEANFSLSSQYKKVSTLNSENYNYNKLYYYLVSLTDSENGRDRLSVSQLKNIIPKEALARGSITTHTDLTNAFNSVQTDDIKIQFLKKVDNQVERLYYAYLLLKDSNGNVVPTNSITTTFSRNVFSNVNKNNFILKPGTLFYLDPDTGDISALARDTSSSEIIAKDKASFLYMLPFLAVITKSPFYVSFYMTYIHYTRSLYFNYINDDSLLQFICLNFEFYREYYPSADDGETTSDSDYIENSSDTYHLKIDATQTINTTFDLFSYNADGSFAGTNVKMFVVIYQENSDGAYYAYRYLEGKVYDHTESSDSTNITFEFKFKTNDVMAALGNYIYITKGLKNVVNGESLATYIMPNCRIKVFVLAKQDVDYGRDYTIDTVKYNLDDIIPNLTGWTLTNVYDAGEDGLDIFYDYSDVCNSYIELTKDPDTKDNNYTIYKMPVVRATYLSTEERIQAFNALVDKRRKYIQSVLLLLEDSLGIDYKFFNTYGVSKLYNITKDDTIDRINLTLKFEIQFVTKSDSALLDEITASIKEYIEDINYFTELHMSNLITYITNKYRNNIVYIKFVRLNNYDSLYQSIFNNPELEDNEFLSSQTVPEFINVNTDNDGNAEITYDIIS